jgi:DNA-directed RNA polymerase specialized sigma24 family protein
MPRKVPPPPRSLSRKAPAETTESPTTSWSYIRRITTADPESARQALDSLLQRYWYSIYVFIRANHGCSHEDAEDITQTLMIHLLAKPDILASGDPAKGNLRGYLLGCAKNFLYKDWAKRTAAKRDIRQTIAWHSLSAKERYEREPVNYMDPERLFARRWTLTLLDETFVKLRTSYRNQDIPFDTLRPFLRLDGSPTDPQLADISIRFKINPVNLRVRIHRLRRRWRKLILAEIKQTLDDPTDQAAEAEFKQLLTLL